MCEKSGWLLSCRPRYPVFQAGGYPEKIRLSLVPHLSHQDTQLQGHGNNFASIIGNFSLYSSRHIQKASSKDIMSRQQREKLGVLLPGIHPAWGEVPRLCWLQGGNINSVMLISSGGWYRKIIVQMQYF